MHTLCDLSVRLAFWLLVSPLLPGLITRVKSLVAGRRGPPVHQLYLDLYKLWHKGVVLSRLVSPGFVIAPAIGWAALLAVALLLPLGPAGQLLGFDGDFLLAIYLLAMARFANIWGALETGSAFGGMGAAREAGYAIIGELALVSALTALAIQSGTTQLGSMLLARMGPCSALLAGGLFIMTLLENCRVPFDDPNTHLELTMVHEAMILDHSGPPLAAILHGASLKLMLFSVLLVQAIIPLDELPVWLGFASLLGGVLFISIGIGLVESLLARLAFRKVPLLLTAAMILCVFALLVAWKGGLA